jgi:hypothetical protein
MSLELIKQLFSEHQVFRNEFINSGLKKHASLGIWNVNHVGTEQQLIPALNPVHNMDLFVYDQIQYYHPPAKA